MRPLGDELIKSARWSLEHFVQPGVTDPLASSYLRAILTLLREAEARSRFEWAALLEESDELSTLSGTVAQSLPRPASLAALAARVEALRQPVVDMIREGAPVPPEVIAYLSHQLEREQRCSTEEGFSP